MPQIQIIGQEKLAARMGARERDLKRQELSQQAYEKSIQFKQMDQQLKLMAKNAENDVEKNRITRLGDRLGYLSNVYKIAMDSPNPDTVIQSTISLGGKELMDDLSSPEVAELIGRLGNQQSGDAQQKLAVARLINSRIGGGKHTMPDGSMMSNPKMPQGDANQSSINAMNGGLDISSINAGGVQIEDYGAQARGAAMKADATARANRDVEMEPIRGQINNYLTTFAEAVQEMGGLEENALTALAKGKTAEIGSKIGNMPATFTLQKMIEPTALMLGSYLNKGRPTDVDAKAAMATLTRLSYTKGVNIRLAKILQDIVQNGNREAQSDLFWALQYEGGSRNQSARAFGSGGVEKVLSRYGASKMVIRKKAKGE